MSYKSVKEILNEVFDSSDSVLKTVYKTDGEVMNMVLDETGDPALKVRVSGLDVYSRQQTDNLLSAKMTTADFNAFSGNMLAPLAWTPLIKNLLTQQGQSVFTFARASAATVRNRFGSLKTVANDAPCFNEDGLTLSGASTNMLTYSEQFDNPAWGKSRATVTANASVAPDGNAAMDKLVEDTSSLNTHLVFQTASLTSGGSYTFSVFLKKAERTQARLYNSTLNKGAYFDLNSGTVLSSDSGIVAGIKAYADGSYRCAITYTATTTSSQANVIAPAVNGSFGYTGDGVSGIYMFGAQLEQFPFSTSYIQTVAAATARAVNSCYFPQADNIPNYAADFSLLFDFTADYIGTGITHTVLSDNSGFKIAVTAAGAINVVFGGANITYAAGLLQNTKYRIGLTKTGTTLTLYINGVSVSTASVSTLPVNQTNMYVGTQDGSANPAYGKISNIRAYELANSSNIMAVA